MKAKIVWSSKGRTKEYGSLIVDNVPENIEIQKYWDGRHAVPAVLLEHKDNRWIVRIPIKRDIEEKDNA